MPSRANATIQAGVAPASSRSWGGAVFDRTANYEEYSFGLLLKYFFEPRGGPFATDF